MAACLLEITSLSTESRLERFEPGGVKRNARADESDTFLAIRVNVLHPGICGILGTHVGLRGNVGLIEAYNVLGPVGCEAGGYTVPCIHLGVAPHLRNVFSAGVGQLRDYGICPVCDRIRQGAKQKKNIRKYHGTLSPLAQLLSVAHGRPS